MTNAEGRRNEVDRFIRDQIDTVPHLEALLLLWNSKPKTWSIEDMSKALYLPTAAAGEILEDLTRNQLIASVPGQPDTYRYDTDPGRDQLVDSVASIYRQELIRVTRLIHSKPSAAVREFARAFRLKKERD
jgi:predicted ArsR family transcriptional regulator